MGRRNVKFEEMKVTRSLLLEFSKKLEGSDSSSMVTNETIMTTSAGDGEDDVSSSLWSIQANAASGSKDYDEDDDDYEKGEEKMVSNGDLEELCQGMKKMGFNGAGKHTRFVYNSDDDIKGAMAVVEEEEEGCGGSALVLKGLPPPKGKHPRFHERR